MEIRTFDEAVAYLESLIPKYDKNYPFVGLARIEALLGEMGNPQDSYAIIHVGGTAGKGSTATIAARIMQESGYKVGLHISPHLEDIRERAQINGKLISKQDFVRLTKKLKGGIEIVDSRHDYAGVTYFEALVAIAFEYFRDEKVDVAVIEVGLGGKIDGTNVVKSKVAVLTNVGLDHTEILGDTVEKIAADKVGIFKQGIDVVSGVTQPSVIAIARKQAKKMGCNIEILDREITYSIRESEQSGSVFDFSLRDITYKGFVVSALGYHQVRNACLAIAATLKLVKYGFAIPEPAIKRGLKNADIPGRFELVRKRPVVLLDGAHSPMKIAALAETLKHYYPRKKVRFVFAVKKDKDAPAMIEMLSSMARKFYFTRFESTTDFGKNMSHDPEELADFSKIDSEVFKTSYDAYKKALLEAKPDEIICITGSLYLVGELRGRPL